MTQPDEFFPEAASNYDSLAAFAAKTEDDWAATNRGLEVARWGNVNSGARGGLAAGLALPIAIGRYIAQQLGAGIHNTLENIGSALQNFAATVANAATNAANAIADIASLILQAGANAIATVGNWISDALNGVKQTWNDLFDGLRDGSGSTNKTSADVRERARAITQATRKTVATGSNLLVDPVANSALYWTGQTRVARATAVRRRG